MPAYAYRAVHSSGRIVRGQMIAAHENDLAHYLSESGLELIEARAEKQSSGFLPFFARGLPPRILSGFCGRMRDLLQAGIPFPDALRESETTSDHRILRDSLAQISRSIENGNGIAASFAAYPAFFSSIFIAILQAGENSGDMGIVFDFLARYAETRADTQENLHRALRYPVFLFLVAGGATAFMMSVVVPEILQFLSGIQSNPPFATRLLVSFSSLFTDHGLSLLAFLLVCCVILLAGRFWIPDFAQGVDAFLLRLPVLGSVILKTSLARFAHSFSLLFRSGCDLPSCLRQASDTIANRALRAGFESVGEKVQAGASLSLALEGVMPAFATGLLRTGERSGNLTKSLDDIATAYEREAQRATQKFISLLEPSLTLTIGGLLAWVVVAVLSPLYGSLSVLGGLM